MREPHQLLSVRRDASEEEIRSAYRKLVRKHHPDLNPEDPKAEERFKELQRAYETLTKPETRGGYRASRQRSGKPRTGTGREFGGRAKFSGDLSDLLKSLGYQTKGRDAGGGTSRVQELRDEDAVHILKRFGIDVARSSKIRLSFGEAADFGRPSPRGKKDRPEKPPINEDFIRPPKPPKPPKW